MALLPRDCPVYLELIKHASEASGGTIVAAAYLYIMDGGRQRFLNRGVSEFFPSRRCPNRAHNQVPREASQIVISDSEIAIDETESWDRPPTSHTRATEILQTRA